MAKPLCIRCGVPVGDPEDDTCSECEDYRCPSCHELSIHVGHRIYCEYGCELKWTDWGTLITDETAYVKVRKMIFDVRIRVTNYYKDEADEERVSEAIVQVTLHKLNVEWEGLIRGGKDVMEGRGWLYHTVSAQMAADHAVSLIKQACPDCKVRVVSREITYGPRVEFKYPKARK